MILPNINRMGYLPKFTGFVSRVRVVTSVVVLNQTQFATVAETVAGTGVAWANPNNALTANGLYAVATLDGANLLSNYLRVTNFGFSVSGTIVGVQAALLRRNTGFPATGIIVNNTTRLIYTGTPVGTKNPASIYPATNTTELLGGSSDLWGSSLTAAQVNDPSFGVETLAEYAGGAGACDAQVDRLALTVYYIA